MKDTTSFKRYVLAAAVSVVAMLATSAAQAATVTCADPLVSGQNHQFRTTSASDCVWSNTGNIGNGGGNDAFLNGLGTNDLLYGNSGPAYAQFGLVWTLIDSEDAGTGGIQGSLTGLTVSGSDNNTFNWQLTNNSYGQYALGLKGGSDPNWAVFLLSGTSGLADLIGNGSWSHVALYGTPTPPCTVNCSPPSNEIPEPGTLALVGLALLGGATLRRRKM